MRARARAKCSYCSKEFAIGSTLNRHEQACLLISKPGGFKCGYCNEVLLSAPNLEQHVKNTHGPKRRHECCLPEEILTRGWKPCGAAFRTESRLWFHICSCHADIGGKAFLRALLFDEDYSAVRKAPSRGYEYKEDKYAVCPYDECTRLLRNSSHLKAHLGEHSSLKRRCRWCGKGFPDSIALTRHSAKSAECKKLAEEHRKEALKKVASRAPRVCTHCQKTFSTLPNLNLHIKLVHNLEELRQCEFCGSRFARSSSVRRHIKQGQCPALKDTVQKELVDADAPVKSEVVESKPKRRRRASFPELVPSTVLDDCVAELGPVVLIEPEYEGMLIQLSEKNDDNSAASEPTTQPAQQHSEVRFAEPEVDNALAEQYNLISPASTDASNQIANSQCDADTPLPSNQPTLDRFFVNSPGGAPAAKPTAEPAAEPLAEPAAKPLAEPLAEPAAEPLAEPSMAKAIGEAPAQPNSSLPAESNYSSSSGEVEVVEPLEVKGADSARFEPDELTAAAESAARQRGVEEVKSDSESEAISPRLAFDSDYEPSPRDDYVDRLSAPVIDNGETTEADEQQRSATLGSSEYDNADLQELISESSESEQQQFPATAPAAYHHRRLPSTESSLPPTPRPSLAASGAAASGGAAERPLPEVELIAQMFAD